MAQAADTSLPQSNPGEEYRRLLRQLGRKVRGRLAKNPAVQTIVDGRAELWGVAGFFDALECGRLMTMIDAVARPSDAYAPGYDEGARTSYSGDIDPRDPFIRSLEDRMDALLGLDYRTGETMQGQRYTAGQQFKPHIDWFPYTSQAWQREETFGGQRAFTAMVYLNPVEAGGETDFPELDIAIAPQPGTLLIWNNADADGRPNPLTAHAGNPVTRGVKYVITKWYRSRPWHGA